jgi:hypothetical protein
MVQNFKGMVTQDFQNFKITFAAKRTKLKNHCFCSFLKNFQRSKKVTNIYRFTSGLLSTTDPFQIQASTGDSKETYLKHRLFSLPGSCVCHVSVKATLPAFGDQKIPLTLKNGTHCSEWLLGPFGGPKKPFVLDGYPITT